MAVDAIKKVATDNNWTFSYGSQPWQNLADHRKDLKRTIKERQIHCMLYNCDPTFVYGKHGGKIDSETTYSGYLIIGVVSDFNDPSYNHKWENNIKPLLENQVETFLSSISGCGYILKGSQSIKEVSNLMDNNFDGLSIQYTLKKR